MSCFPPLWGSGSPRSPDATSPHGTLFLYSPTRRLAAFQSGASRDVAVLVGGLGDTPGSLPFAPALYAALHAAGWSLCEPQLSSSGLGWGVGSVDADADELLLLLGLLSRRGARRLVLVGHSTGCQDVVHLLRRGPARALVTAAVLQAAVSDREYLETLPDAAPRLALARALVADGRGGALLPRDGTAADEPPVCAARHLSLAARLGGEDMFSSDLTDAELASRLGHMSLPLLLCPSLADEYVPDRVDVAALARRLAAAMPAAHAELAPQEGAAHAPDGDHAAALAASVVSFLKRLPAAGD